MKFTFKSAVITERSLIHKWLEQDYIKEWIHGEGLQGTLQDLDGFFQGSSTFQHWVAYDNNTPFAYLLTSPIFYNPDDIYAKLGFKKNSTAISLDIFIGNKDYLGKGYAHIVIQEFLVSQFSHTKEVFIDPEKTNTKAIHVYTKTGFQIMGEFTAKWHPTSHVMMHLNVKQLLEKMDEE
ncbi:MAG: GNAT family N-acetyltransferase [Chlamydiales bacterium]|nr:GNAT family N-acetyltransferase [Chlamydiales bacterium]